MKTAEHFVTQPEIFSNLFTKPYVFVPRATLLNAIGFAEDDIGGDDISWITLHRVRENFHKRVICVLGANGACLVPNDAPNEFVIENFRPMPESVYRLSEDQRFACETIWPHVKRGTIITKKWGEKMMEVLRPILPEGRYQALEKMVHVIATSSDHSVGWHDFFDGNTSRLELGAFCVLLGRLNAFMAERDIPVRLAPTHVESYHYMFKSI